jgi:hypothetical protein
MSGKNKKTAQQCQHTIAAAGAGNVPGAKGNVAPCTKHWIGVRVEDEDGAVVRDIDVHFELTDGSDFTLNLQSQVLGADGSYKTEVKLPGGNCAFGLPEVHDVEWWPQGEQPAKVPPDDDDSGGDGLCAASIADRREFRNYHSFWDDDKNKPLRDKKRNPNQLSDHDQVYYSTRQEKTVDKAVDSVWTLVVKKKRPVKLRIVLFGRDETPLANTAWKMTSPLAKNGNTGADGLIEIANFPPTEKNGVLTVTLPARAKVGPTPANPAGAPLAYPPPLVYTQFVDAAPKEPPDRTTAEWRLEIGSLPPHDTKEGVQERLGNIGFRCDRDSGTDEATRAVKAYQLFYLNDKKGSGKAADIQTDLLPRHDNP